MVRQVFKLSTLLLQIIKVRFSISLLLTVLHGPAINGQPVKKWSYNLWTYVARLGLKLTTLRLSISIATNYTRTNHLILCLLVTSADYICKQFGPRSGPTQCQAWSGSELFDTLMIDERIIKKLIFKKIRRQLEILFMKQYALSH